jgi:hypothetical protein
MLPINLRAWLGLFAAWLPSAGLNQLRNSLAPEPFLRKTMTSPCDHREFK